MDCERHFQAMADLLAGETTELPAGTAAHLVTCGACRRAYETQSALREALGPAEDVAARAASRVSVASVLGAIRQNEAKESKRRVLWAWGGTARWGTLAAALLIAFFLGWVLHQGPTKQNVQNRVAQVAPPEAKAPQGVEVRRVVSRRSAKPARPRPQNTPVASAEAPAATPVATISVAKVYRLDLDGETTDRRVPSRSRDDLMAMSLCSW